MIGAIISTWAKPYEIERRAFGDLVDGRYTQGVATVIEISAAIVPERDERQLLRLPEGDRTKQAIRVFSQVPLRLSREPQSFESDVIRYSGQRWEVSALDDWNEHGGFYDAIAVKMTQSADEVSAYYGAGSLLLDSASEVKDLTEILIGDLSFSFDVNAGAGEYIYFWHPSALGEATFYFGSLAGGFMTVDPALVVDGVSGVLSRSVQPDLGQTQIRVSG